MGVERGVERVVGDVVTMRLSATTSEEVTSQSLLVASSISGRIILRRTVRRVAAARFARLEGVTVTDEVECGKSEGDAGMELR
jgi:hypothetical protein